MMSHSPSKDLAQAWDDGYPLDQAWWVFAAAPERNQYRNAGSDRLSDFYRDGMRRDLTGWICVGELIALGIQIAPIVNNDPEMIPRFIFAGTPDIDWDNSVIRAFGRIYEGVRVVSPDRLGGKTSRAEPPREAETPIATTPSRATEPPSKPEQKRRGRPPVDEALDEVVRELAGAGRLRGMSRKEQEAEVRELARERHPSPFPKPTQPSRSKILEALKRAGV